MTSSHPDLFFEMQDNVAVVRLSRPAKRNALNDALVLALRDVFATLPAHARAAVLHSEGEHFCAGLDLSELQSRDAGEGMLHSRMWHQAFQQIQFGAVPVVAALHGAVVGGGHCGDGVFYAAAVFIGDKALADEWLGHGCRARR